MADVLRLIDANLNRAREALRVLEDYVRFVHDDAAVAATLKALRHDLASATDAVARQAVLHRSVETDVGKDIATPQERSREDVAHVVLAAGKRLTEALRSLEEYLKVDHPAAAAAVEALRYRAYGVEAAVVRLARPVSPRLEGARLYVLITESACGGRDWAEVAEAALRGGAQVLQLREKGLEGGELLERARRLVAMCRAAGAVAIINDRPDIAVLAEADGVHVGQGDLPAREARRIVGPERIVGVSTHHLAQARQALEDGADYIGAGPVWRSGTKPRDISPGLDYLRQLRGFPRPVFAIAGITLERVREVREAGVDRIAVTAAATQAADVEAACRALREALA
ncbi:MAG: thiamine phosphate synthase [Tepidisphaerales bacterium]